MPVFQDDTALFSIQARYKKIRVQRLQILKPTQNLALNDSTRAKAWLRIVLESHASAEKVLKHLPMR